MDGTRLILNDGTVIENGRAGLSGGELSLWMPGYSIVQVAMLIADKTKMQRVISSAGGLDNEYVGYTECVLITIDYNGETFVSMRKE